MHSWTPSVNKHSNVLRSRLKAQYAIPNTRFSPYLAKNKAASIETAFIRCPRNRGGIAFAGADDGALYLDLFPLPYHVLTP